MRPLAEYTTRHELAAPRQRIASHTMQMSSHCVLISKAKDVQNKITVFDKATHNHCTALQRMPEARSAFEQSCEQPLNRTAKDANKIVL